MTIKEFAKLCDCNPQTLRYYDREDLLKPVKVDEWSGYRNYIEEQALTFVKIKNLQIAGFTIGEIRALLNKSDEEIFHAFEIKIAEEEKKIQEIKKIQQTYQSEYMVMKTKLESLRNSVKTTMEAYDPQEEFGINKATYDGLIEEVDTSFEKIIGEGAYSSCDLLDETNDNEEKAIIQFGECLNNPNNELIYESHRWINVKDFINQIPFLENEAKYHFLFKLQKEKDNNTAFANTLLGLIISMNKDGKKELKCNVIYSDDGENHFWLLKQRNVNFN